MEKNTKKTARKLVMPGIQWLPHLSYCAGLSSQKQPQLLLILKEPFLSLKNREIEREKEREKAGRKEGMLRKVLGLPTQIMLLVNRLNGKQVGRGPLSGG